MVTKGFATQQSTQGYQNRFPQAPQTFWRTLGKTDLTVSAYGFGCYRVHLKNSEHKKALKKSLLEGCNLIDTSSNYGDGSSEIMVGQVLEDLIQQQQILREEVVIVSKVGYVQGHNMQIAQEREAKGTPFPNMVKYSPDCWHCIHPDFLEDQLTRSLERLNIDVIDVYLLHNPEYFLMAEKKGSSPSPKAQEEYYNRIDQAFRWLEQAVQQGRIQSYGISSNTFPVSSHRNDFTSLEKIVAIAENMTPYHHFTTVQFPLNLFETGAVTEKNQHNESGTLVEFARQHNLATLVNRPLNCFYNNTLIRLADFRQTDLQTIEAQFQQAKQAIKKLDEHFNNTIYSLEEFHNVDKKLFLNLQVGGSLIESYPNFEDLENWNSVREYYIKPAIINTLNQLTQYAQNNTLWINFVEQYMSAMTALFDVVTVYYENMVSPRSIALKENLDRLSTDLKQSHTLSQKSLQLAASVEGITTVLVGMRREIYVEDVLGLMQFPYCHHASHIYYHLKASQLPVTI